MTPVKLDLLVDPPPAQRFDLIYTAMTLHHVPDTDHILRVFHDLLKPGGTLCIADLDQEDGSFHGPEVDVHHGFDQADLSLRAAKAGFADMQFQTVFSITKENESRDAGLPGVSDDRTARRPRQANPNWYERTTNAGIKVKVRRRFVVTRTAGPQQQPLAISIIRD